MKASPRRMGGAVILVLGALVALAAEPEPKVSTPAERFQALLQLRRDGPEALSQAKTAEERQQIQARLSKLPVAFVELAEENPKNPVAVEALIQTIGWV